MLFCGRQQDRITNFVPLPCPLLGNQVEGLSDLGSCDCRLMVVGRRGMEGGQDFYFLLQLARSRV
jgi:hypothetical protein